MKTTVRKALHCMAQCSHGNKTKMCLIIQEGEVDVTRNITESPSHPNHNGYQNKINNNEKPARVWTKRKPCTWLVSMQISPATMKISVVAPPNLNIGLTHDQASPLLGYIQKK